MKNEERNGVVKEYDYIEQTYGLKVNKGQIVRALGKLGVVTKKTNYVFVKLSEEKTASPYHPSDIEVEESKDEKT